ncbi:hypothetical protein JDS90_24035 [Bacillus cereus]|nr:hypothetical protein [Bacillus cereus]MBJ8037396.1 hypothetical protein [Bacillus cereus]
MKTQILLNQKTKEILCIAQGNGHIHEFRLFKESISKVMHKKISLLADSGYQGIQKLHTKSRIPKKPSGKCPLTKAEKREAVTVHRAYLDRKYQRLRSSRFFHRGIVIVENVICYGCLLCVGFIILNCDTESLIIEEVYYSTLGKSTENYICYFC